MRATALTRELERQAQVVHIDLTPLELRLAREIALEKMAGIRSKGERDPHPGCVTVAQGAESIAAELAVARLLNRYPLAVQSEITPADILPNIEVRSSSHPRASQTYAKPGDSSEKIIIGCTVDAQRDRVTVHGWISAAEAKRYPLRKLTPSSGCPLHWVPLAELRRIDQLRV